MSTSLPTKLFINNEYVASKSKKECLKLYNPADGVLVSQDVSNAGPEDVDAAVAAARAAFPIWKKYTNLQRRDILLKFANLILENTDKLAELSRLTLGAPFATFGRFEAGMCVEAFIYYAGWIDKYPGESYPAEDGFLKIVRHEPLGVACGIAPWNGPLATGCLKAAPALATGNTFIFKPSEKTPFAALALGDLIKEAGFPPGVFQVLSGDGATGALLASHMDINKVSFTGSVSTGKKIQQMAAASNLKRVTLELGGKSPAVVFDDCNFDNAVTWCVNALTANSGQVCFAATRVYVQEGIFDKFVKAYKEKIEEKAAGIGHPNKEGTLMGPLVDKLQYDRVNGFIERGEKEQQGTLLTGGTGKSDKGYYIPPTVFLNTKSDAEIYKEEIFGPVSVLNKFSTEEEVLEKSNNSNFGLMAGVFTQDINKAMRVSSALDAGMVGVNCVSMAFLIAPFGGTKESGIGREMGHYALRAFTEPKTVMINLTY